MSKLHSLTLKIHRYDPEQKKSWVQEYKIDVGGMLRFTDVLRKINQEQDPGLAWYLPVNMPSAVASVLL